MAQLSKPLKAVMNVLTLVAGLIKLGISGVQKTFTENDFLKVVYIPIKDLKIDPKYQRLINKSFIKKAKEFEPYLVKPLSVFKRPNGDYMIVDGQHTACLAATYVAHDNGNFKLPCQVQVHPANYTAEECEEAEAKYFKRFNSLRNIVSSVAKLRSDIAQGAKYATRLENNFKTLGIQVEGIGAEDDGTNLVKGYDRLRQAIGKYGSLTKEAVDLYKGHNASKENKWTQPLNGGMILGLAATIHFVNNYIGDARKKEGFLKYLHGIMSSQRVAIFIKKTQGPQMDVLILENIIGHYNMCVAIPGVLDYPAIGMEKDDSIWQQWKDDPIHSKNTVTEKAEEAEDEEDD